MPRLPLLPSWRRDVLLAASATAIGACEEQANDGLLVRWFQRITGNAPPAYWCMSSVCRDFERGCRTRSPLILTGSCEQQRQRAITRGAYRTRAEFETRRVTDPQTVAGWVGFCLSDRAHHVFVVGGVDATAEIIVNGPRGGFLTIEGNAADPKKPSSRNGDGKYEGRERGHPDDKTVYGFIDPEAL